MRAWHVPPDTPDDYHDVAFWDGLIQRDPVALIDRAADVLEDTDDPAVQVLARWATSRAQFDLGQLHDAQQSARLALGDLDSTIADDVRAAVVMSSAVILAESGDIDAGLAALDVLAVDGDTVQIARVELQRGYILHHAGRLVEALAHLDRGERLLGRDAHPRDVVRVHNHRGMVLLQEGRFAEAEADFLAAERVAHENDMTAARALSIANRAVLYGRARQLADSLRAFEAADAVYREIGSPARMVALAEIDRAEVMMHSGLVLDAVDAAGRALDLVETTGNRVLIGDAQLVLARAELAAGSPTSVRHAERAAEIFEATGRPDMVPQAAALAATARLRTVSGPDTDAALLAASELATRLRAHGWERQADDLALERLRAAVRDDRLPLVADELAWLRARATSEQRDLALVGLLSAAWGRRADGALTDALAAAKEGLDRLDDIVAETTTLEERSAIMRIGADLSQAAIEVAVELGQAEVVLAAAEGTRARALHDELAERDRHRPLTEDGAERLREELVARLDGRVFVEWLVVRGRVMAVVVDASGTRLVDVAAVSDVVRARDRVVAHLDFAVSDPDGRSLPAVRATEAFDELVVRPLDLVERVEVVMAPDGVLHGVPWSGVPSLGDRSVVLTPNAQIWLGADRRAGTVARGVGLVVGPDVAGGAIERAALERWYPGAAVASGEGASAATVASMLGGHGVVHVAAHGSFRSDRPLLSTLRLADGESTLADTIPARVTSTLVILSSCEGAAQGAADGSEVLGLGAVLLARGAATVVAPLTAVRDLECADFVAEVHGELAGGLDVGTAIARVRGRWLADDDLSRWAVASSFTCLGSGSSTVAAGPSSGIAEK